MEKDLQQNIDDHNQMQSQVQKPIVFTSFIDDSQDKVSFQSFQNQESDQFLRNIKQDCESGKQDAHESNPGQQQGRISKFDKKRKTSKIIEEQKIPTKERNSLFSRVFKSNKFAKKNNNTVRFLIDLAVQHLPNFRDYYSKGEDEKILNLCTSLRLWHLAAKKNVYNCDHLTTFFGENQNQICSKKTREIFNFILRNEALNNMKKPRSQIQDKAHYLRVAKVFSLRCRHHLLCLRNQSR